MENTISKLSVQDRMILFCAATGIDHGEVGILARDIQSMVVRGFIAHNRERGCMRKVAGRAPLGVDADLRLARGSRATHGYEPTREAAMAVFARSWRRE